MTDLQTKAEQKICQLLNNIYKKLSKHPLVSDQQRQLLPAEQELMQKLDQDNFLYQSLLRILAIDSYSTSIFNQINLYQDFCGMLTALLQNFNQLGQAFKKSLEKRDILEKYNKTSQCFVQCINIAQQMFPKCAYNEDQNKLLQSISLSTKIEQSIITKIRHQNQQLNKKAQSNQLQILNMQNKLTKLLKQHQGCERSQNILGTRISNIELRQELSIKQAQIQQMNQEFSFQIEKYNTVFQAMKRELEEMKGYQNIDLIQQIQLLETEIVRLRQQRDRDQIIIRQLRNDNTMFTTAGYSSPKQANRYQTNSRYEY